MAAVLFQPLFDRITFFTRFGMFTCLGKKLLSSQSPIDSSLYTPKTPSVFMTNVKEFVLTDTYYAAIKNDGTLWMWGCDTNGELGIGDCELNNFFPRHCLIILFLLFSIRILLVSYLIDNSPLSLLLYTKENMFGIRIKNFL